MQTVDGQGEAARWDWGRDHYRGDGLPVEQEPVEDGLDLLHGGGVEFDEEAVLAGDAVAFAHLGEPGGQFGDLGKLTGGGTDSGLGPLLQPGSVEVSVFVCPVAMSLLL